MKKYEFMEKTMKRIITFTSRADAEQAEAIVKELSQRIYWLRNIHERARDFFQPSCNAFISISHTMTSDKVANCIELLHLEFSFAHFLDVT